MTKPLTDHLNELSDDNLRKVIADCYDVLEKRKKAEKTKLIEAFRTAFFNLENAGIEVRTDCDYCEDDEILFDNLYFN